MKKRSSRQVAGAALSGIFMSFFLCGTAAAQDLGGSTGFEIPRFVTMRSGEANVRRGPSTEHMIDWVFERPGLPVVIRAEFGHWRLIEDFDGEGGWVHRALISGLHNGMVIKEQANLHVAPSEDSEVRAYATKELIVHVEDCMVTWCRVSSQKIEGWMLKEDLWGASPEQISPAKKYGNEKSE
jgi:SH3-like domain-containing protein